MMRIVDSLYPVDPGPRFSLVGTEQENSMKTRNIGYWAATGLFALAMAGSGVSDLLRAPNVMGVVTSLGYPAYFLTIIGLWKLLGVAALLAPRLPRLKEWAYAGFFFELTGAAASHVAVGDAAGQVAVPLAFTLLLVASWALRPEARLLRSESPDSVRAPAPIAA
jgi:hypothetical protein